MQKKMKLKFFENNQERWDAEKKLRYKVAKCIEIRPNSKVLDVLVGYADFSRAIAKIHNVKVMAIEIVEEDIKEAKVKVKKEGLQNKVKIIKMDATDMKFPDESFDYVVNFIGWEDLIVFSGREAIEKVFSEMSRVLKKNGLLLITFIPEVRPKNFVERKDIELERFMWSGTKRFLPKNSFLKLFKKYNIKLIEERRIQTNKNRIRPEDAKGLIKWMCKNYPKWSPKAKIRRYPEIIEKFGDFIEKYGMHSSFQVIVLIGKKV